MTRSDRDRIDEAIDQVAARLTQVDDDAELAGRILASLPERSGWWLQWLMPRLAAVAALAIGLSLIVLRPSSDRSATVLRTFDGRSTNVQLAVAAPEHRTYVAPASNDRRTIVEPSSTIDVPDFDRSLPALEAAKVLTLDSLAPAMLPEDAPLTLLPLAIADLPLTGEIISPR